MEKKSFIWTDDKIKYISDNWNKISMRQLTIKLNTTSDTINEKAKELGLPAYSSNRWTDEEVKTLIALAPSVFYEDIAKKIGKTKLAVYKKAEKMGIKLILDEDLKNADWTDDNVQFLVDNLYKISIRQIGFKLGITPHRILRKLKQLGIEFDNNRWTDEEVEILRKMASVCHYSEISKVLNRSKGSISAKAFDLNIPLLNERRYLTDEELQYIKNNWNSTSASQIARDLKCGIGFLHTTAKKIGLPSKGQNIKWTEEVLAELRELAKTKKIPELAEYYETSTSAITTITHRHKIPVIDSKNTWSDEQKKQLIDLAPTHTVDEIVKILNKESHSVRKMAERLGITILETIKKDIGRPWTAKEEEQLKTLAKDHTSIQIAIIMDRTDSAIKVKAKKLGISIINQRKGWTNEEKEQLISLAPTHTIDEIAKTIKKETSNIKHMAKNLNIKLIPSKPNNSKKTWTTKEEEQLKTLAPTHTLLDIAIILNRTDNAVRIKGKNLGVTFLNEKKNWTDDQKEQLKTLAPTHTVDEIVKTLNINSQAIRKMAKKLGINLIELSNGAGKSWSKEEEQQLKELALTHTSIEISCILNRTDDAIRIRAKKLGILLLNKRKIWTREEENELASLWGRYSIDEIAEQLNRTTSSISNRAHMLKLGSVLDNNYEGLTIQELCDLFQVNRATISITWVSLGLEVEKRQISNKVSFTIVTIPSLLKFLEIHQDIWDSRTIEQNVFGSEPIWFLEKRKQDLLKGTESIKRINTQKQQLIAAKQYFLEQVETLPEGIKIKEKN